jgi:hypothetical protein
MMTAGGTLPLQTQQANSSQAAILGNRVSTTAHGNQSSPEIAQNSSKEQEKENKQDKGHRSMTSTSRRHQPIVIRDPRGVGQGWTPV